MRITFTITAEVRHQSGKFIAKDEVAQTIIDELDGCCPGDLYIDESVYEVEDFTIEHDGA